MQDHPLISIVLATYNERENIIRTIEEILRYITPPVEVVVIDDDSPDKTWELVQNLKHPSVKLIRRIDERGLASAFYRGIQESRGDIVGWMDADMSMPPSLLTEMIIRLSDHDIAIGSRYVRGGKDNRSFLRVFSSFCINKLAQLVLTPKVRDFDSGFVVVKREVLKNTPIIPVGYGEYFIEFLYAAMKRGYRVSEIPYVFSEREMGTTKSAPNLRHFLRTGFDYVKRIFLARLRN